MRIAARRARWTGQRDLIGAWSSCLNSVLSTDRSCDSNQMKGARTW
jgi:hypothetical protein